MTGSSRPHAAAAPWHAVCECADLILDVPAATREEALVQLIVAAEWLHVETSSATDEGTSKRLERIHRAMLSAITVLRGHIPHESSPWPG